MRVQHDVEDSELGFLVKERRKRSLSWLLEAQSRTHILKCTPREALIRAGRPFYFTPGETHSGDIPDSSEDVSNK